MSYGHVSDNPAYQRAMQDAAKMEAAAGRAAQLAADVSSRDRALNGAGSLGNAALNVPSTLLGEVLETTTRANERIEMAARRLKDIADRVFGVNPDACGSGLSDEPSSL